jgi:hypothetical protein
MALFKDKLVVLVGPAPHILERKQDFSKFDYLCRVNDMVPLTKQMIKATGDRVDVLYARRRIIKNKPHLCDYAPIVFTTDKGVDHCPAQWKSKVHYYTCPLVKENRNCHIEKELGCLPNTGFRAMVDILYQEPKLFYLTGFTFYHGKTHYEGYGRGTKHKERHQKQGGEIGRHKQEPQFQYFKKNIAPYVEMDAELKSLL